MNRKEEIINEAQKFSDTQRMLGFINGANWADKTMIEKACKWLEENATYTHPRTETASCMINLARFKQAMMEE